MTSHHLCLSNGLMSVHKLGLYEMHFSQGIYLAPMSPNLKDNRILNPRKK